MTAFLFALVPVALFALIAASCFVGCGAFLDLDDKVFDDGSGETPPFTKYSDTDVIGNKDCVAYWPLFDASAAIAESAEPAGGDCRAGRRWQCQRHAKQRLLQKRRHRPGFISLSGFQSFSGGRFREGAGHSDSRRAGHCYGRRGAAG